MAEEFKKTGLMDGMGENNDDDDFKNDPEGGGNKALRLPFALCKAKGIKIQDWWTPRDAWDALKNGGYVEDVDEEYAKHLKEEKREKDKKWRKEHPEQVKKWEARAKTKKEQLKDPNHTPDKSYVHEDGKIAGAPKGKPMTHEQADSGNVNPYYNKGFIGYKTNCQTCVATYVARRQGYNVSALPNLNNSAIAALSHNTALAYVDNNGNLPSKRTLDPRANNWKLKDGRIYSIQWHSSNGNAGHIVVGMLDKDGAVMLYDPQTNQTVKGDKNISKYINKSGANSTKNIQAMDLTDCRINEIFADDIMKKRGD